MSSATKEMSKFYEAMLSFPGMNQKLKIGVKISRTNVLLLTLIIEQALMLENSDKFNEVLAVIPDEAQKEMIELYKELLTKADLNGLHEKLSTM